MADERQRDYELVFGNVAANAQSLAQQLKLDSDGPFCLREIGLEGAGGSLLQSFALKWTDPFNRFVQQEFVSSLAEVPYPGNAPILTPVISQMIYPPNANIVAYLSNTNPSASLTGGRLLFRGVTLYPDQTVLNRQQYPKYFKEMPFAYPIEVTQSTALLQNQVINIRPDSDFALRAMLITLPGPNFNSFIGSEYAIQLKDQNGKYYQSQPVFFNSIAGEAIAHRPGLFQPEIYLARNSNLYFDLTLPSAVLPATFWIRFIGAKIFQSTKPC